MHEQPIYFAYTNKQTNEYFPHLSLSSFHFGVLRNKNREFYYETKISFESCENVRLSIEKKAARHIFSNHFINSVLMLKTR